MIIGVEEGPIPDPVALSAVVPTQLLVPAASGTSRVIVGLVVTPGALKVTAPGLKQLKAALAPGAVDLVEEYCAVWTRWLARNSAEPRVVKP